MVLSEVFFHKLASFSENKHKFNNKKKLFMMPLKKRFKLPDLSSLGDP